MLAFTRSPARWRYGCARSSHPSAPAVLGLMYCNGRPFCQNIQVGIGTSVAISIMRSRSGSRPVISSRSKSGCFHWHSCYFPPIHSAILIHNCVYHRCFAHQGRPGSVRLSKNKLSKGQQRRVNANTSVVLKRLRRSPTTTTICLGA